MHIILNGESTEIINVSTVNDLIHELKLKGRLAIEINRRIVPHSLFHLQKISSGDEIEIVHAIGGG